MPWNCTSRHNRKFMKAEGVYLNDGKPVSGELNFWGEWEPDSRVTFLGPGSPTQLHEPFLRISKNGSVIVPKGAINTDPFVFDKHFYYCFCQQHTVKGPTIMNRLDKGSLILFGSYKHDAAGHYFALDTVYVVGDYRDFAEATYPNDLAGFIPKHYDEIMQFNPKQRVPFRCYKGASFSNPVDGMYSFVPCKLDGAPKFERVKLTAGVIPQLSVNQTQGRKNLVIADKKQIKAIWDAVRNEAKAQGYLEGIEFTYKII